MSGKVELKPCPFCGSPAAVKGRKTVFVSCTACTASTFQQIDDKESAARQWNERHADAQSVAAGGEVVLDAYDAGLLSDHGGGNVDWWWDYIRAELERAHDHYQSQVATQHGDNT